jgi:hypothetical protein
MTGSRAKKPNHNEVCWLVDSMVIATAQTNGLAMDAIFLTERGLLQFEQME